MKEAGYRILYAPLCRAWHLRHDTPDEVLRTFWNWNYFGYEHNLTDQVKWTARLAATWSRYRTYCVEDQSRPSLRMLTLKMAWSWTIRDLFALRKSLPQVGHVPDVVKIAETVLTRYGMEPAACENFLAWLNDLAESLDEPVSVRLPLNHEIARKVCAVALECISDGNYWRQFPV
jgi:hypothetical protein